MFSEDENNENDENDENASQSILPVAPSPPKRRPLAAVTRPTAGMKAPRSKYVAAHALHAKKSMQESATVNATQLITDFSALHKVIIKFYI